MKPIDADALREKFGDVLNSTYTDDYAKVFVAGLYAAMNMPTLTPPNEPLTLAELREMDGEPVWDEKGKCYLVDTTYQFCSDSDIEIAIVDKQGIKRYPYRRTLYRRPPEGEENI